MRTIVEVKPLPDQKLFVRFSDGESGVFDVRPYVRSEFFRRLDDEAYFQQTRLFFGGVAWPEGHDLGPDTIAAGLEPLSQETTR